MATAIQRLITRRATPARVGVPDFNLLRVVAARQPVVINRMTLMLVVLLEMGLAALVYQQQPTEVLAGFPVGNLQGEDLQAEQDLLQRRTEGLTDKLFARRKARNLIFQQFNWPNILAVVFNAAPDGVKILSFRQSLQDARVMEVGGVGTSLEGVNTYRNRLLESKIVDGVSIKSINLRGGENTDFVITVSLGLEARK